MEKTLTSASPVMTTGPEYCGGVEVCAETEHNIFLSDVSGERFYRAPKYT